jgi:high-affinity Fe2+/Pb2+ permease
VKSLHLSDARHGQFSLRIIHFALKERKNNKVCTLLSNMFGHAKYLGLSIAIIQTLIVKVTFFLSICIMAISERVSKLNYREQNNGKKRHLSLSPKSETYKNSRKSAH